MSKTAKIAQIVLLAAIVLAGIRSYFYFRERQASFVTQKKPRIAFNPDYYVTPKKLRPQDLKDAQELTKQPEWVRNGYVYTYYPYSGRTEFQHAAGTLAPLEKLDIDKAVLDRTPGSATQKQVVAVFQKNGKSYAVPVGVENKGNYTFNSDDMFFIQDPHELYKHWSASIWEAIDSHQARLGMNELQASFAIGVGSPEGTGMENPRIVDFPNNGHPLRISFTNGKATDIQPGS